MKIGDKIRTIKASFVPIGITGSIVSIPNEHFDIVVNLDGDWPSPWYLHCDEYELTY